MNPADIRQFGDALRGWRATLVAFFIAAFPLASVLLDKGATGSLVLLGLLGIVFTLRDGRPVNLTRDEKLLVFAAAFFFFVAVLAWLLGDINYLGFKKLGRYLRFLLLIPIFVAVRRVPGREAYWWGGLALGATGIGVFSILRAYPLAGVELPYAGIEEPFAVAALSLVMAIMSVGGHCHFRDRGFLWRALPVIALVSGFTAFIMSGRFEPFLAVPVLTGVLLLYLLKNRGLTQVIAVVWLAALILVFWIIEPAAFLGGHLDNRLTMWMIAWRTFLENPLFGSGVGGYMQAVREWYDAGLIDARFLRFNHPHNEYLSVMASRGLLGLTALLLLFMVPLKHFLWAWRHKDPEIVALSFSGIALIVAYMHFAMVEAIFDRTLPITFYVFSLSVIYGLLRARERVYLATRVPRKHSLSVIIIAKNEADRIGCTLQAVKGWADEIIVLDSGSDDATVDIAKKHADIVRQTDWPGFGKQKQRALDLASCDWVLALDADEEPTEALKNEIDHELQDQPDHEGYRIPRPLIIFGRQVDYGGSWQAPLRLFRRDLGRYTDVPVHEKVVLSSGKVALMRSPLLHPTWRDYGHALEKFAEYAWLQAGARWEQGKRSSLLAATSRALYNFVYNYFGRFGFLDGRHGFALACLHAQYTFNKYAALWANEAEQRNRERNRKQ